MKPGRELDVLIAKEVLGCQVGMREIRADSVTVYELEKGKDPVQVPWSMDRVYFCTCLPYHVHNTEHGQIREYSTDIAAAWEVVEYLLRNGSRVEINGGEMGQWYVHFGNPYGQGYGDTAPHAISLAALKAMEGG